MVVVTAGGPVEAAPEFEISTVPFVFATSTIAIDISPHQPALPLMVIVSVPDAAAVAL